MQRKSNPRIDAVIFLAVSAALSVAVLTVRNLYDDEISSINYISLPFAAIVRITSQSDVHPPGMYLLAHLALCVVHSYRWINLFPLLVFYAGLSCFVLSIVPVFLRTRTRICFLMLATLHPQQLMWNNTFRWYSWWTGLALIALVVSLQPRVVRPQITLARALSIGLLLGGLFYLNYITLLFAAALAVAIWVRYRHQPHRHLAQCAALAVLVFAALVAPQLHSMLAFHLPGSQDQRSSILVSIARLLLSLTASEAFLPWHPLALIALAVFTALGIVGIAALFRANTRALLFPPPNERPPQESRLASANASSSLLLDPDSRAGLASILLFASLFFVLVAASGLGGKPRNGLLLIPLLTPAAALAAGFLRPRIEAVTLVFLVLWTAVGCTHLLGRYGLTKATMIARPEQVVDFIQRTTGNDCPVVVTYDTELSFTLSQRGMPVLILVSGTGEPIFMKKPPEPAAHCTLLRLYTVRSYKPEIPGTTNPFVEEAQSSTHFIHGPSRTDSFSRDADAPMKRRLANLFPTNGDLADAAYLPDYRYIVTSGPVAPEALPALLKAMPDFISSSGPTQTGSLR